MPNLIRLPFRTDSGELGSDRWSTTFIRPTVWTGLDVLFGATGDQAYTNDFPALRDDNPGAAGAGSLSVSAAFSFPFPDHSWQSKGEGPTLSKESEIVGRTYKVSGKTVTGDNTANRLSGGAGSDRLSGGGGNDTLLGGAGRDTLIGGSGNDSLVGGSGDDRYVVDSLRDRIRETAKGGLDTVEARVSGYTLAAGIENLILSARIAQGKGNALANVISGNRAANTLDGGAGDDTLIGGAGNDKLIGGTGNDTASYAGAAKGVSADLSRTTAQDTKGAGTDRLSGIENAIGSSFGDTLTGGADSILTANRLDGGSGDDALFGGGGDDTLIGGSGDDTLIGGSGSDSLAGGAGNDLYSVVDRNDLVLEAAGAGIDTVESSVDYTLGAHVEHLRLTGAATIGTGNDLANVIMASVAQHSVLRGLDGNDTLLGANGDDTLFGGADNDSLDGGAGDDALYGDDGDDMLIGGLGGADRAIFSSAESGLVIRLDSTGSGTATGQGNDSLRGFEIVEAGGFSDLIEIGTDADDFANIVRAGAGYDTIRAGGGADRIFGEDGNDSVEGGTGSDTLDGGEGTDALDGGAGNDTLIGGLGSDNIAGGEGDDGLDGGDGADTLLGGGGSDTIVGGEGADSLDGGTGADRLIGGAGSDSYVVDDVGDIIEGEAEGTGGDTLDWVRASVDYTLAANLEYLTLTGNAMRGTGNALANRIAGNGLANTLDGGLGADTLIGGAGNDTYILDETGDTITGEAVGAGNDFIDTVVSAFDYTLGDNLENLTLTGAATRGTGNALANRIEGNGLANTLDGGAGADTLVGGAGDDTYLLAQQTDVVIENAGEGRDTIELARSFVQREFHLAANVENVIVGGQGVIFCNGNHLDNYISMLAEWGQSLLGFDGNDTLDGGYDPIVSDFQDTIDGGDGYDYTDYSKHRSSGQFGGGVFVDLAVGQQWAINTGVHPVGPCDLLISIEGVIGTNFDDRFVSGFTGAARTVGNTFKGGAGMDIVDYRHATSGVNVVLGDGVEDSTRDIFEGIEGLSGSKHDDSLSGDTKDNYLDGGEGNDALNGRAGHDIVDYFLAPAAIAVDLRNEFQDASATGGYGRDRLVSIEGVRGGIRADTIWGNDSGNTLLGMRGADQLHGLGGADTLYGAEDNDTLDGGDGADILYGGTGFDRLIGGADRDTFVFAAIEDTAGDVIADFTSSQDVLDLSGIDAITGGADNAFSSIIALSSGAPTTLAAGTLGYDSSNGILYGLVGNAGTSAAPNFAITVGLGISWGMNGNILL
ncbi:calcium-binding protein [Microvirga sp. CF3062]|uniref:beta strand repeat-containing protein n=1 Tax=Microvirga sp. CF3062 TaxID=3110182 RepID=UPI002E7A2FDB|nr:calcium-binding protein [Microvirga sp. CF3062]MEE1656111.1 calcium-binding protein [Microvirga sp. CF3062]